VGVTLGGILGHSICTGAAVLGGRQLATHIQERTVHVSRLPCLAACLQLSVWLCVHGISQCYTLCLHLVHLCFGGSVPRLQLCYDAMAGAPATVDTPVCMPAARWRAALHRVWHPCVLRED
jgi:Uncharacterized protein family UPF0016